MTGRIIVSFTPTRMLPRKRDATQMLIFSTEMVREVEAACRRKGTYVSRRIEDQAPPGAGFGYYGIAGSSTGASPSPASEV